MSARLPLPKLHYLTAAAWAAAVLLSLAWNLHLAEQEAYTQAASEARANFNKDKALRYWAASKGGVYVPVKADTEPNPFLAHIPERDITTPSGKTLTLMNPAYMLRQTMNAFEKMYGVKGHITSLVHYRPETAPDSWETAALQRFEEGQDEVLEMTEIDGKPYLRLMQPLLTDQSCLKCHGVQGYAVGDVRGGVSVSVPMEPYLAAEKEHLLLVGGSHLFFLLAGRSRE